MHKLKMIQFWIVSFSVIIWNTLKGNTWHSITLSINLDENEHGHPERKIVMARRRLRGFELTSHIIPAFVPGEEQE